MPSLFDDLPPETETNVPGVLGKRKYFDEVHDAICKQPKTGKYISMHVLRGVYLLQIVLCYYKDVDSLCQCHMACTTVIGDCMFA